MTSLFGNGGNFLNPKTIITSIAALRTLNSLTTTVATVLGYYVSGDGGGGVYYVDTADTASVDNGGTIIVAADGARWKLVHTGTVSVCQFGMGSNVNNDIVQLQSMINAASSGKFTIRIPKAVKCFIEFSVAIPYLFLTGAVNIVGDCAEDCGFRVNVNYAMVGHAPLFCFGISSVGSAVNKVTGTIKNVGWWLTAGCNRFERMCHVYGATDFTVQGCYADFRQVTWPVGNQAGGWWSSNVQPTFAVGQTQDTNITFRDNTGYASAEYQNCESFGFTNVTVLRYLNNKLIGFADDMAAHSCIDVIMDNNHIETISGRYYAENSQHVIISNNYVAPLPRPIVGGYLNTRSYIGINMQSQYINVLTDAPNYDVTIKNNNIYLPQNSYCNTGIICYGVQDGLTISDNIIYNDASAGSGAISPTTGITVSTLFRAGWTGPAGNPDVGSAGSVKLRAVSIKGNKMTGGGWTNTVGDGAISVVVYAGGVAGDIIGEVEVEGNYAPFYNMTSEQITFRKNYGIYTATDPMRNVSLIAVWNDLPVASSWVGLLPNSANINNTNFPQATPTFYTTLDSEGLKFLAQRAGRVIGIHAVFTAALTAGNNLVARILKNGVQIGVDTDSSTNTPSTNPARYVWNFVNVANMTFVEGDKIEVLFTVRAAQGATNIVGRATLLTYYI